MILARNGLTHRDDWSLPKRNLFVRVCQEIEAEAIFAAGCAVANPAEFHRRFLRRDVRSPQFAGEWEPPSIERIRAAQARMN